MTFPLLGSLGRLRGSALGFGPIWLREVRSPAMVLLLATPSTDFACDLCLAVRAFGAAFAATAFPVLIVYQGGGKMAHVVAAPWD